MVFRRRWSVDELNARNPGTLNEALGIRFTEVGEDYVRGTMPCDARTKQPFGLLHGGANVALAETLGSIAGMMALEDGGGRTVGLEINANHVRAVRDGLVTGTATAIHVGKATQVWDIRIVDERDKPVCVARLTLAVRSA